MKNKALCVGGIVLLLWVIVPMMSYATPVLLVRGLVTDSNGNPIDGLDVTVKNTTSPRESSKSARTGEESGPGIYSVIFFSLTGSVPEAGDEIQVTVEQDGEVLAEETYIVTDDDIVAAGAVINIQIESIVPAPILENVASDSGIITGGDIVKLVGEHFQEGASVTVGGDEILDVVFVSPTELSITIPEAAVGAAEIVVTNPDGQSATIDVQIERRIPAPTLNSVASDSGIITGGDTVKLVGEHFQEGARVTVGGDEILDVVFVSPTELSITIPEAAVGAAEIVVTNPDGQSATIDVQIERRIPAPSLESVASDSGIITGGDTVKLVGEHFQEGVSVTVGGDEILDVVFVSPTELSITIPEAAVGAAEIVVTNPDGQSATIDVQIEPRPPAPILDSVASDSGIITGGDMVKLVGEHFQEGVSVTVGGDEILDIVFVSPTELSITIPEAAVGAAEIVVTNPDGQSATIDVQIERRIPAPTLNSVASDSGIITGGDTVKLVGEHFQEGVSVTVGGDEILDVVFVSPTELSITIPEAAVGAAEIVVTNPDGQSATIDVQIEPRPPAPILDSVVPEDNIFTVRKSAELIGENFQEGASVTVGGDEILNVRFCLADGT